MPNLPAKKKLINETTCGLTIKSATPIYANNLGACGWDFLIFDTVNSALGQRDTFNLLTAACDVSEYVATIVKVGGPQDRTGIQQATDTGAVGVIVPHVTTKQEAETARSTTLYPGAKSAVKGTRSLIGPVRAHNKKGFVPYFVNGDDYVLCALQLEEAPMDAWAEILSVDFHVAVLDVPKLCVTLGMYDELLASPPQDATLTARLAKWNAVYMEPAAALLEALKTFVALCKKAGKTPGVLLGDAAAGPAYARLGFKFLGAGSDLSTLHHAADFAVKKQAANESHVWKPPPLSTAAAKARSAALPALLAKGGGSGAIMRDATYEAAAAVRGAPLVFVDGLGAPPATLEKMLYLLDGDGHRLVRVRGASESDAPSCPEFALALGADSVVAPVASAAEARLLKAGCDYKARRGLSIGPDGAFLHSVEKSPLAGAELLTMPPPGELAGIAAAVDFVMCSEASWLAAVGSAKLNAALAEARAAVTKLGTPFVLLADAGVVASKGQSDQTTISAAPAPPPPKSDPAIAAYNARLTDFIERQKQGAPQLGIFMFSASPAAAAAAVDMGHDWVLLEWQHAPLDLPTMAAMVAAIHQRGGIAMTRVGGYHDAIGIYQAAEAGIDVCLIPVRRSQPLWTLAPAIPDVCLAVAAVHQRPDRGGDRRQARRAAAARRPPRLERLLLAGQEDEHHVPVRDERVHRQPDGQLGPARARLLLRRSGRPRHVVRAAHARRGHRHDEGQGDAVDVPRDRRKGHQVRQDPGRVHARRRPVDAAQARLPHRLHRRRHLLPDDGLRVDPDRRDHHPGAPDDGARPLAHQARQAVLAPRRLEGLPLRRDDPRRHQAPPLGQDGQAAPQPPKVHARLLRRRHRHGGWRAHLRRRPRRASQEGRHGTHGARRRRHRHPRRRLLCHGQVRPAFSRHPQGRGSDRHV